MGGSIRLHEKLGVNPKLTFCPRCGGDARELILVGADDGVYKCRECDITVFGYGLGTCPGCNSANRTLSKIRTMEEHERLPGSPCEKCEKEINEHRAVVEAGGVYFKCTDCGVEGVIRGTAQLAKDARKELKVEAPKPCGVEFSKKQGCPKCGEDSASPAKA